MKKEVTLLCRGKSLDGIKQIPAIDHCVLVNAFHLELETPDIHEYVSNCSTVTHVLSLGAYFPRHGASDIYSKYNFDKIVLPYIQEVKPPGTINVGLPVACLSDKNKADMVSTRRYKFTSPSSGMDALLYCINDLESDIVNIIGMDFYDNIGYFTDSYGRHVGENNTERVVQRMKGSDHDAEHMIPFFLNLVKNHPEVQFNLYTKSAIVNNYLDNLKIKKV